MKIQPVILAGGSGARLWPMSREFFPKPFLPLVSERTLIQETVTRLDGVAGVAQPLLVCNEEHRFLVAEQALAVGKNPTRIILEPEGRNTAPALTLAALSLTGAGDDPVMVVMPADHAIGNEGAFRLEVEEAARLANEGSLVTFGIVPDSPHTGYGYIRKGVAMMADGADSRALAVDQFVEKPDLATARGYLDSGLYLWNSGIFAMRASRWLEEIALFRPDILSACRNALEQGKQDGIFFRVDREAFRASPSDSIDYAVMEKTNRAAVIPLSVLWSDVGAWSSVWSLGEKDESGNVCLGDVLLHETDNSLVVSDYRFVAAVGMSDVVIVETADAVLVSHRDHAQNVKEIVTHLKREQREECRIHRKVHRPWGTYESIDNGTRFQVKRIVVKPGAALSLQMHHHRAEHWVVVKGTARVTRGDEVLLVSENQSTYIPLGTRHRLENPGSIPLEIIEVQSGSYLGEDDIVRFEDNYDRS